MESFVCEIQSLKLFRLPKPCVFTSKATSMDTAAKSCHARPWQSPLLTSRCVPQPSRTPWAQKATAPGRSNPLPEPHLDRRMLVSDEEEDGDDEADLSRLAEVLERMEEQAITGDDVGRDAEDYNRRARLFYKSSRVFQDLKERDHQSGGPPN